MHKRRRELALALGALGAVALGRACFVDIADPQDSSDAALEGGSDGSSGGTTGGATGGDARDATSCGMREKLCSENCVSVDNPDFGCDSAGCTPCPITAGTQGTGCSQGQCVASCAPGFFDCDDKAADCETQFGPPPSALPPPSGDGSSIAAILALTPVPVLDGDTSDWADNPLVKLEFACADCSAVDPLQPGGKPGEPISNPTDVALAADLDAYFRVAWNPVAFYVAALVKDNEIIPQAVDADAASPDAAPLAGDKQDGLELFLDGDGMPTPGFSESDHHLFIGLNGQVTEPERAAPSSSEVDVVSRIVGNRCYVIETKLAWSYVRKNVVPVQPASGALIGFDVGVNDWDNGQREHQVLWRHPGTTYTFTTMGYPIVTLE